MVRKAMSIHMALRTSPNAGSQSCMKDTVMNCVF